MWRSGVAMAIGDILATDTVATDIVATDIVATMVTLMEVITEEGTIIPTTGLITEAITATHMVVATTADIMAEDSGLASVFKTE
jgi:predicted RNA methylase